MSEHQLASLHRLNGHDSTKQMIRKHKDILTSNSLLCHFEVGKGQLVRLTFQIVKRVEHWVLAPRAGPLFRHLGLKIGSGFGYDLV
jgi:hypothetical protein